MHKKTGYKRIISVLLVLICMAFSGTFGAEEPGTPARENSTVTALSADSFSRLYKCALTHFYSEQIVRAYGKLLTATNRENFRGYCAMYVNNLLVYFGINSEYIKGNANNLYAIYSAKSYTDGGFFVEDFSARQYTLKEALSLFAFSESPQEKILVIFSKGPTEKGKEFGHVFYVNAIMDDTVIFSESSPSVFTYGTVQDGNPLILTIDEVCEKYDYYKFEGLIHFSSLSEPMNYTDYWRGKTCRYLTNYSPCGRR